MDKSVAQTRIQMRLKAAGMNIYSLYNNPPPPPQKNDIIYWSYLNKCLARNKNILLFLFALLFMLHTHAQTDPPPKPFITTWETSSDSESITIPTADRTYSYTVNWGDNSTDNTTYTGDATHTYSKAGTYRVTISGTFPHIRFARIVNFSPEAISAGGQIRTVEQWGTIAWTSMAYAFVLCNNLTINATDVPDLSRVTSMFQMFGETTLNGDISKWNVSNVRSMNNMFFSSSFNGDISGWNVSSVTTMSSMFYQSSFNGDVSKWNVSSVSDMIRIFADSPFNGDISRWDVSSIVFATEMFASNTAMSSENYDKLLIGWSTLDTQAGETRIPSNITFSPPEFYSCRGKTGRDTLTMRYSWNILGDELVPILTDEAELPPIRACDEITAADLTAPTANNKCDGTGTKVTATHSIPADAFPITSDTVITWTYTDNGKSIVQTQQVKIITDDTTPPEIMGTLTAFPAQCEVAAKTDLTAPTTMDNCDGEITATTNDAFPITSNTTITWTYTDASNNTATQTQQVIIDDTMSPVPNPDNILTTLTAACSLAIGDITIPEATDNCDGPIMATTDITPPITASTTIMWTYTDAAGNTATQTQEVVIDDDMPPMPNPRNNLSKITRQCSLKESELTVPAATDNCTSSVTVTNNVVNFPIMSDTTITWIYTDGANNTVTQTQQVTIADTTDPVPATADLPTLKDCSQITSLITPTATDNCDGIIAATTAVIPPITKSTTITWTYTDAWNNMVTQTQEVIIGDTQAPMPEVSNLPTLTEGCPVATMADLTAPTATDNCDNGTITATTDSAFPITSTTTVTWTYTDAASNTSTQTQEVTCPLSAADDIAEAVIFPNPSGRYLEVRSATGDTFQLLSLSGKPLLKGTTNIRLDITSLQSGLYLVQLPDGRLLKFVRE